MKLLTLLVVLTLVATVINIFSTASLSAKINTLGVGIPTGTAPSPSAPSPSAPTTDVSADDDPFKGDPNAPITIIEFSDFECPFCGRFYSQTLDQLTKNYIDTGKVKLVYRDFPLSFHPNAQKAAEAAECAKDQGKFWEMHDTIFENQQAIGVSALKGYAVTLGLDSATFNSCLDSGDKTSEVRADFTDGQKAGVSGTPTFFINGVKLVGAQPYAAFQQEIDSQLS